MVKKLHVGRLASLVMVVLAIAVVWARPAAAACHLAGFVSSEATVGEADGEVTVTVELQGRQPNCAGTVQYETQDDSATAGADYEAQTGELTFEANDDRVEDIVVAITMDDEAEGPETFRIVLTGADGVSVGSPSTATVTIIDDDDDGEGPTATATDPATTDDTDSTEDVDDLDASEDADEPGDVDAADDAEGDGDGGSGALAIIVAAVIVVAGLGGLLLARMRRG